MNLSRIESLIYSDPVSMAFVFVLICVAIAAAVTAVVIGSSTLREKWRHGFRRAGGGAWRDYRIERV
jgi:hypothetical protein